MKQGSYMMIRQLALVFTSTMFLQTLSLAEPNQTICDQKTVICKQHVMHDLENCQTRHRSLQAKKTICSPSYRLETDTCYQRRKQCQHHQQQQQLFAMASKAPSHY